MAHDGRHFRILVDVCGCEDEIVLELLGEGLDIGDVGIPILVGGYEIVYDALADLEIVTVSLDIFHPWQICVNVIDLSRKLTRMYSASLRLVSSGTRGRAHCLMKFSIAAGFESCDVENCS